MTSSPPIFSFFFFFFLLLNLLRLFVKQTSVETKQRIVVGTVLCLLVFSSCLHCLSDALLPSAMSLTSTTLGSKSKRSWSTAVAPLANHVRFTLTLTSHGITNQRPVLVSLGSRRITVTRYKQKQKIELTHSISLCWGRVGDHPNPLLRVVLVLYRFLSHSRK